MLTLLTFLPLLGALALLLVPAERVALLRQVALATTGLVAALGLALWFRFDGTQAAAQMLTSGHWFTIPGTQVDAGFTLGVDGISLLMVALTALLMPIVILSTYDHIGKRVKEFLIWMLVMETGMLGVFLSLDLVLFYVFWEVSLIPLYFIVGIWGGERRLYATIKFFLYTMAGSLVMLVGIIYLVYHLESTNIPAIVQGASGLPFDVQTLLFFAFALAFAIKVPVLPFHTWLADAHTEAPTSGSVLLAGVLLKMGTYGLLRFGIEIFPAVSLHYAWLFMALGAIGILYGAFLAMAQSDLKRLIACSSVSHLGFVVLGLFALNESGLRGSVLQMVNHGISTGLLFLLVGMIYERRHTRQIDQFGGIAASMPIFALCFVVAVLSSVGLPGLNGFVGEYMILLGAFLAEPLWGIIGVSGVIFGAVYLLSATRRVLFGAITHPENRHLPDATGRELAMLVPMLAFTVWIGIQPGHFLGPITPSLDALQVRIDDAREVRAASLLSPVHAPMPPSLGDVRPQSEALPR